MQQQYIEHVRLVFLFDFDERDARRLPNGKNYAPERTRLESVAGFNTAECNAEPPLGVRALLITLNPDAGKFNELAPTYPPHA